MGTIRKTMIHKAPFWCGMTICLALFSGCQKGETQNENLRPVYYQEINNTSVVGGFAIPGVIQYTEEAKLSFRVSGLITGIAIGMGQKVTQGQLLATLDDADYSIQVQQAEASRQAAEANANNAQAQLTNAKSSFLRSEQLYIRNNLSLTDFEKIKAQYENAKAQFNASTAQVYVANSQVVAAKKMKGHTLLKAPMNGTISQLLIVKNEMIGAGQPALIMSGDDDFEVKTMVPESWINELTIGQKAVLKIASLNQDFIGTVREISPGAPNNSGYPVKIDVLDPTNSLKSGMSCKITLPSLQKEAPSQFIVNVDAVSSDANGDFVYKLEKQDNDQYIARKTSISTGQLSRDGYIVLDGVDAGDLIATAGIRFLYDGKLVILMDQIQP
jgi:multidrug efflux system membrane fusion protein